MEHQVALWISQPNSLTHSLPGPVNHQRLASEYKIQAGLDRWTSARDSQGGRMD